MGGESVPLNYIPIAVFAVIALGFGVVSLVAGWIVRPSRPYRAKLLPYESGSPLFMDARIQFPMRYYIIAMLFVVFDIEIVFMFSVGSGVSQVGTLGTHRDGSLHCHPGGRVLVRLEKRCVGMGLKPERCTPSPQVGEGWGEGAGGWPFLSFPRHRVASRVALSTRESIPHALFA